MTPMAHSELPGEDSTTRKGTITIHYLGDIAMKTIMGVLLAVWLAAILLLGVAGVFLRPPGTPPIPILLGVTVPLIVFLVAYWNSARFRSFILTLSLPLAAAASASLPMVWRMRGTIGKFRRLHLPLPPG
jgi:1,4-dihydroxy-2-naphthoate octaprenyltransferase